MKKNKSNTQTNKDKHRNSQRVYTKLNAMHDIDSRLRTASHPSGTTLTRCTTRSWVRVRVTTQVVWSGEMRSYGGENIHHLFQKTFIVWWAWACMWCIILLQGIKLEAIWSDMTPSTIMMTQVRSLQTPLLLWKGLSHSFSFPGGCTSCFLSLRSFWN